MDWRKALDIHYMKEEDQFPIVALAWFIPGLPEFFRNFLVYIRDLPVAGEYRESVQKGFLIVAILMNSGFKLILIYP